MNKIFQGIWSWFFFCNLVSCVEVGSHILIAGQRLQDNYNYEKSISKDGPALMASFSFIRDLAVDDKGNLYVVDEPYYTELPTLYDKQLRSNTLIRKISSDGRVTTFAGKNKELSDNTVYTIPLIGLINIEILDGFIYFNNYGCVLRYDLNQTSSKQFETMIGQCVSSENAEKASESPKYIPNSEINITELLGDGYKRIYFGVSVDNKSYAYMIQNNEVIKLEKNYMKRKFSAVDSKSNFYYVESGPPGPGLAGVSTLHKLDLNGDYQEIPGVMKLHSPGISISIDKQDNIYLFDESHIKRLNPQGQVKTISNLRDPQGRKIMAKELFVTPDATRLYVYDDTSVYQILLPK